MDLTEAEDIKKRWQEYTEELYKKIFITFPFHFHALEKEMATQPVFLPGKSQAQESLVGCHLWGRTESDTTEAT